MRRFCRLLFAFVIVASLLDVTLAADYSDQVVVRVYTRDSEQLDYLDRSFDLWTTPSEFEYVLVRMHRKQIQSLQLNGFRAEIDAQETKVLHSRQVRSSSPSTKTIPGFACYRTVAETYADLALLASNNPGLAQWQDIGDSWEKTQNAANGDDIFSLVISSNVIATPKPDFIISAAMHARELTPAETATRFAEHLIAGYGTDADITWILDYTEVHIIPQLNPDGRVRVENGSSFWRKNTNSDFCGSGSFPGVDLNRNSSFFWGTAGTGSSGQECSQIFRGPSRASEPETQVIEDYMAQVFTDQKGPDLTDPAPANAEGILFSIHSSGRYFFYPWEDRPDNPPNHDQLRRLGRKFGFFNQYTVCQDCFGTASGTTVDEAYGEYGVASYTLELGTTFREDCNDFDTQIYPVEMLPALLYAAKVTRAPYLWSLGPDITLITPPTGILTQGQILNFSVTADDTRYNSSSGIPETNDQVTDISDIYYSIDTPPWALTVDIGVPAVLGNNVETLLVPVDTNAVLPGQHTLYFYARDVDGNIGPPTAVFLQLEINDTVFTDAFEG